MKTKPIKNKPAAKWREQYPKFWLLKSMQVDRIAKRGASYEFWSCDQWVKGWLDEGENYLKVSKRHNQISPAQARKLGVKI